MILDILDDKFYTIVFFCIGIGMFFYGFYAMRRQRMVENIPTSTVRGLAMGLAELSGKAKVISKDGLPFKSPFSGSPCVYFSFSIDVMVRQGKRSYWHTLISGDTSKFPFWLIDDTGKIPVYPAGADIDLRQSYNYTGWGGDKLSPALRDFMTHYKLERFINRHL
jgi:hypothetical protein